MWELVMKCEACLQLLEEYIDSELIEREAAQVSEHLVTCVNCAKEFDTLFAEQEIYSRYDRELDVSPQLWNTVAAAIANDNRVIVSAPPKRLRDRFAGLFVSPAYGVSFAGAIAVLIVATIVGVAYFRTHRQQQQPQVADDNNRHEGDSKIVSKTFPAEPQSGTEGVVALNTKHDRLNVLRQAKLVRSTSPGANNQSDVVLTDLAYSDTEDQDTQRHIEQSQNLLKSVRNLQVAEGADDIDVSYEKALSRRLLNENVVLRRDAEMSGKFPVKTLLSSLEPFLIDIANLPDRTSADDLRVIKERVQKTEIVAALYTF